MIRAILFDLDGVLVDSIDCEVEAWRRIFEEFGVPFSRDLYLEFTGTGAPEVIVRYIDGTLPEEEVKAAQARKASYVLSCLEREGIREVEGARELAEKARDEGYKLALITGAARNRAEQVLEKTGLRALFPVLVASDDGLPGKRSPEPFLKIARELGVPPEECALIEDGAAGIAGAKKAGMKTVGVATTNPKEALSEADAVFSRPGEIPLSVLRQL